MKRQICEFIQGEKRQICRKRNGKSDALTSFVLTPGEEEKEKHTAREASAFSGLQARVALPLVLDLPTVEAIRSDADRWGREPDDPVFNQLPLASVQRELEALIAASQSSTAETIKAAIAEAHNELANMIDSGSVQAGTWKAALAYFRKVYCTARARFDQEAKTRETASAIDAEKLAREKMITEKAGKAFDQSAALGIEAKQKRLEKPDWRDEEREKIRRWSEAAERVSLEDASRPTNTTTEWSARRGRRGPR